MLTLEQMLLRLVVAVLLGIIIGLGRELAGKSIGIRTSMVVSAGAAIFSIIALELPYLVAMSPTHLEEVLARNSGFFGVIANVVTGVGFLGAGIIIKEGLHIRGLTTAAIVWLTAAIGVLAGIGLIAFATISTIVISLLLFLLRRIDFAKNFKD